MLKIMRENVQSKFIKGLLWAVIISFVAGIFLIWGSGQKSLEGNPNILVRVGDSELTRDSFNYKLNRNTQKSEEKQAKMQAAYEIINQFISTEVWLQEADNLGITVSSDELYDEIINYRDPAGNYVFQDEDGNFIGEVPYTRIINRSGQSVGQFEKQVKNDIKLRKLRSLLLTGVEVSDHEALEYFRLQNEKAKVKLAFFDTEKFKNSITPNPSDLEKYYRDNQEKFRRPVSNKYEIVMVPLSNYLNKVQVTDQDTREYYQSHKEDFFVAERRRVSHILFRLKTGSLPADEEKVKETAEKVLKLAKDQGEDFAQLAARFSEDEATAAKGGDLGYFSRGDMQKPFEDAAFEMQIGEIRGPIKTSFGYHFLKLLEVKAPGYRDYADVKGELINTIKKGNADDLRQRELDGIVEKLEESDSWQDTARENNLLYSATEFIPKGGIPPKVPYSQELYQQLGEMKAGQYLGPLKAEDDLLFMKLLEQRESYVPPMGDVIKDVENYFKSDQGERLAEKTAREVLEKVKKGEGTLEEITASAGGAISDPEPFTKIGTIGNLGRNADIANAAFREAVGTVDGPFDGGDGYYLIRVEEKFQYDQQQFQIQSSMIKEQLLRNKQNSVLTANMELKQNNLKIDVNEKLLKELVE